MKKQLTEEQKEKKRIYIRNYMRQYRKDNLQKVRDYQKQWERDNRSVKARQKGIYRRPWIGKFEVKKAEPGKPFLVCFD